MKAPVDHDRGGAGAVAETVDRLEREASVGGRLVKIDPEAAPRVRGESLRTHRLTRLGLTQAHQVSAGARVAEVVVEADDAVHLGAREVQALGHQGNGSLRYKAECRLYRMQYFEERSGASLQVRHDAPHHGAFSRRKAPWCGASRSEEHTSELQSRGHLVCRLLLEKKKKKKHNKIKAKNNL